MIWWGGIKWSSEESAWDAMATCFFLDTAKNVSLGFLELEILSPIIMVFRGKGGYPLGNDHISHPTGKGKSSTQKCQTEGDMWSFPGGYLQYYPP